MGGSRHRKKLSLNTEDGQICALNRQRLLHVIGHRLMSDGTVFLKGKRAGIIEKFRLSAA